MSTDVTDIAGDETRPTIRLVVAPALVPLFVLLIVIPLVATFATPDRKVSEREQRSLMPMPALPQDFGGFMKFPEQMDKYARDQFGFRETLITWQRLLHFHVFDIIAAEDAIVGKDKWLFINMRTGFIPIMTGEQAFAEEHLQAWVKVFQDEADWYAERGIKFLVTFVPNKYAIYPEKLPGWLPYDADGIWYPQIVEALKGYPNLEVLDVRPALLKEKKNVLLYSPADMHWNGRGAYIGYREMMNSLIVWYPGLAPNPPEAFDIIDEITTTTDSHPVAGMSGKTGLPKQYARRWLGMELKEPKAREAEVGEYKLPIPSRSVSYARAFEVDNAPGPRTVVFGDSYRWIMMPYLSEHFERIVYVDNRSTVLGRDIVETEKPELVIFQAHGFFFVNWPDPNQLKDLIQMKIDDPGSSETFLDGSPEQEESLP